MADPVPPVVDLPDLERIVGGDWRAVRDAIEKLAIGLNQEIIGRAQVLQPLLAAQLTALTAVVNTFANQPSGLGASDAGLLFYCTDYNHVLRWSGSVWGFAPGDPGNHFYSVRPGPPQEVGWVEATGAATDYLTVGGAALTLTAFVPPNVAAGYYLKTAAAYTGALVPVSGVTSSQDHVNVNAAAFGGDFSASNSAHEHDISTFDPKHLDLRLYYRR